MEQEEFINDILMNNQEGILNEDLIEYQNP